MADVRPDEGSHSRRAVPLPLHLQAYDGADRLHVQGGDPAQGREWLPLLLDRQSTKIGAGRAVAGRPAQLARVAGGVAVAATAILATVLGVLPGCGGVSHLPGSGPSARDRSYLPLTVGAGERYRPSPGLPAYGRECLADLGPRPAFHLELFAHRHVIAIPPGIGVVDPRSAGPRVAGARCFHPLVTLDPTGVVEFRSGGRRLVLGEFFALWGQRLSPTHLASFGPAPVHAFVNGRFVSGDPAAIVIRPHQEIVLESAGFVPPHRFYVFAGRL